MSNGKFHLVAVNPNDAVGGAGCVCSEQKQEDCEGPYAVFFHTEMASNLSPHVVICHKCAADVVAAAEGDVLAGGEHGEVIELGEEDLTELTVVNENGEEIPEV